MSLNKACIGMSIALAGCTLALTAQAASDHEIAVVAVAIYQVCGQKHPEKDLSFDQFISLHSHMSTQMADDIREIASQPKYKAEVEDAVLRTHTEASQDLLEVICDSYYRDAKERK